MSPNETGLKLRCFLVGLQPKSIEVGVKARRPRWHGQSALRTGAAASLLRQARLAEDLSHALLEKVLADVQVVGFARAVDGLVDVVVPLV